ncbi:SMP-30/gluconolactonase/LRE family protein [Sabulicella rubraurantiaca]|uniref:SMP-30/gluconolactonase/LRE family protein n=1 Tax=Sabulicella rubraurantiaca TaxID=2811429 RepID=UPI001A95A1B6|nr:SMP-30/gluconolactonase/LRE family protein [Sabulicella rubraurantiaca]
MPFFAPPPRIGTEVFTRLPDRFRRPRATEWARWNRGGRDVDSFLEGPCFDAAGRLYVTDIPYGRIFRIGPDGDWDQVAEYDGWPNGLKVAADGTLLVTDYKRGLIRVDPGTGAISPILETARSEGFKGLNDLALGADGSIFFTDQGQTGLHDPTGRVYRLRPDGRLDLLIGTVPSPNGIVVAPDLSHCLVAVTRANQIWRLPLHGDGAVTKAGVFLHLHGGPSGPDGLAWDPDGNLLVAHTGIGTIWRINARAEPILAITSCAGASTTNLCLGGRDGRDLFITDSETGSILRARVEPPGERA